LVGEPEVIQDYTRLWQAAEKIVYSKTLEAARSARTRIERDFDPESVRRMKAAAGRDISVGGPHLAAEALRAGLVDELHLLVAPVVIGGGNKSLPDGVRIKLDLIDHRAFRSGVVNLHYRTTTRG
jgi:dihydrofolate reductase